MRAIRETGRIVDIPQSEQGPRLTELPLPDLSNAVNLSVLPKYQNGSIIDEIRANRIRINLLEQLESFANPSAILVNLKEIRFLDSLVAYPVAGGFLADVKEWAKRKNISTPPVVYTADYRYRSRLYQHQILTIDASLKLSKQVAFALSILDRSEIKVVKIGYPLEDVRE